MRIEEIIMKKTVRAGLTITLLLFSLCATCLFKAIPVHAEEPEVVLTQEQMDQLAQILYQQALQQQAEQAAAAKAAEEAAAAQAAQAAVPGFPDTTGYTMLGAYSTNYNAKIPRATNVTVASNRINGYVLNPGDLFSFTTVILPRTTANGYVSAPVIVNKEFVPGLGGGICQVSSTLYACMLTCGVPALERHPHSLPVSYIPAGMDATISGTAVDLKFANPYDRPLMITATPDNGKLTVGLWLKN